MTPVYVVNPDIVERYAQGETAPEIAAVYGVAPNTVIKALKHAGVKVRVPGRPWTRPEEQMVVRLQYEGMEHQDIADLICRSRASVRSKLTRLGKVNDPEAHLRRRGVDYSEAA